MIKVLLIDHAFGESRPVRTVMGSGHDFEVKLATTHYQVLNSFRSNRYDVCVVDSTIDDGLSILNQARGLGSSTPIILIVSDDAGEALKAMRAGAADCLVRSELNRAVITESVCYVVEQTREASLHAERVRRYLALMDNAPVILYSHDLQGNLTSINRTGERLTGYSDAEIRKMNVSDLVSDEFQPTVQAMIARMMDARTQVAEYLELSTRSHTPLGVQVNAHPIQQNGKTTEIQVIARRYAPVTNPTLSHPQSSHLTERFIL